MAKVRIENGVIVGTSGGKYELKNPLARRLLDAFDRTVVDLVRRTAPSTIVEVGCGEGHVTRLLYEHTSARITATDLSATVIAEARALFPETDRLRFEVADIVRLPPFSPAPDAVVCCEVLEHLNNPSQGLAALVRLRAPWYVLSVPREPLWRILNMLRGAYWRDFGNSPGHIQHWSKRAFLHFLAAGGLTPVVCRTPIPWTIVLCRRSP